MNEPELWSQQQVDDVPQSYRMDDAARVARLEPQYDDVTGHFLGYRVTDMRTREVVSPPDPA